MEYEANTVRKVVDISQKQLSQWQDRQFIKPSTPAEGQGTRNRYSFVNICQVMLFKRLNEWGLNRKRSSAIAFDERTAEAIQRTADPKYKNKPMIHLGYLKFHTGSEKIKYWGLDKEFLRDLRHSSQAHIENLVELVISVEESLKELETG
jgi:hypothetical protein